ncbi:hypothetical protein ARAM_002166 [Aspergillus rambellii]|uniref:Monooxygenase n=3 Tax=Aspergillus subgen. Nidulantes TaxID=2720870 RepID=A0A0F8UUY2_9EURO|nr:hypothetical protein AOCH_002888 [Aspergillus ochraceoroseus]KKK23359.1 hypothetical protein ARAM_002166 [Aspergillus rambellii]
MATKDSSTAEKHIFCAIIGAGMCGVSLGSQFLRTSTLRADEFVIFDRNDDFGGVWRSNRYPGAACDIPSHAYVMPTCLNPNWSKKFSEGAEIQQYYAHYADKYKLRPSTIFNVEVHEARWNEKLFLWEILVEDRSTGYRTRWTANVVFDNGGGFHRPKYAAIPGREDFQGDQFHTGEWPTGYDLRGKRVALIGTGPSAAQVGPKIQPLVDQLYMYQRSAGHVLPRNNHVIPRWQRLLFWLFPPVLRFYHSWWCRFFDQTKNMWMSGTSENKAMHEAAMAFLNREVPDPELRRKLRPTATFGCKRVLFLDNWYSMFNQHNVELVTEKPVRISERGIVSVDSARPDQEVERPIDVLIWGTGFDMNDSGGHFQVYGEEGKNLSETWRDYPETYWSVGVTGFPNFFLTLGPNSTNYWSNITTVVEIQINYHCAMVKHIKRQQQQSNYALYPDRLVQKLHNDWLRENRGTPSFLVPGCATYHQTPSGATPMYNHYRVWQYRRRMSSLVLADFVEMRKPRADLIHVGF